MIIFTAILVNIYAPWISNISRSVIYVLPKIYTYFIYTYILIYDIIYSLLPRKAFKCSTVGSTFKMQKASMFIENTSSQNSTSFRKTYLFKNQIFFNFCCWFYMGVKD